MVDQESLLIDLSPNYTRRLEIEVPLRMTL